MTDTQSPAATIKPRNLVELMPEYHPPLAARTALRLDFNENTFAPSPRVIDRILKTTSEGLTKYPEREPIERIAAAHFGLAPDQVLLTNGVDEAIRLLCLAFLEEDDEALIATPTFFMYDVSVQLMSQHLVRVQADESLEFPFERFLAAITPKTKLIMVSSPNNPTGGIVSREHLLAIAAAAPHAVVFVGAYAPQAMGDYVSGPNHVLPTGRNGRIRGGLSVMDFVKVITVQQYTRKGLQSLGPHAAALADAEGLAGHAASVRMRMQ